MQRHSTPQGRDEGRHCRAARPTHRAAALALVAVLLAASAAGADEVAALLRNPDPAAGEVPLGAVAGRLCGALARGRGLQGLDPSRVAEAAAQLGLGERRAISRDEARRLAEAVGAEVLLAGTATVSGFEIAAHFVESSTGAAAAAQSVEGRPDAVFDLVDLLGQRLAAQLEARAEPALIVASLPFQCRASVGSGLFVGGLPDMLATSLRRVPGVALVEGSLVLQGLEASGLEPGQPLSPSEAVSLARWLGADVLVEGAFADIVQIDVEAVAGRSGRPLGRSGASAPRPDLDGAVDRLAGELGQVLSRQLRQTRTVAVLSFQNHGGAEYDHFVRGIADMLTTSLGQAQRLTIIERIQIERALRNFNLEMSGPIDADTAVEVGAWLGADAVVLGSFLRFGATYRIDARLIDAATGEVVIAESVRGPENEVISMVDELGLELIASFGERDTEAPTGTGTLEVVFRTTKAEMGERPVYYHVCKLYVDGSFLGLSPVVRQADRWVPLFRRSLRAGRHQVQVVHGYVRGDAWDGQMDLQPRGFAVDVEPGSTTAIRYTYEVGWFEDRFVYEPSWPGAPLPAPTAAAAETR